MTDRLLHAVVSITSVTTKAFIDYNVYMYFTNGVRPFWYPGMGNDATIVNHKDHGNICRILANMTTVKIVMAQAACTYGAPLSKSETIFSQEVREIARIGFRTEAVIMSDEASDPVALQEESLRRQDDHLNKMLKLDKHIKGPRPHMKNLNDIYFN